MVASLMKPSRRPNTFPIVCLSLALHGAVLAAEKNLAIIEVSMDEQGNCHAELNGEIIPRDFKLFGQKMAVAFPNKKTLVEIAGRKDTPYRCVGGLVFNIQRLGYSRVGFISDPPPEPIFTPDK